MEVVRGSCPLAFADLPAAQLWEAGALAQAGRTASAGGLASYRTTMKGRTTVNVVARFILASNS
ncbi:MAG TPA: hypothetical protein VJ406_01115 [Dehalococcoidia bacterium]|nr:hypothetical protein [Dehalococcoidia bacterium]